MLFVYIFKDTFLNFVEISLLTEGWVQNKGYAHSCYWLLLKYLLKKTTTLHFRKLYVIVNLHCVIKKNIIRLDPCRCLEWGMGCCLTLSQLLMFPSSTNRTGCSQAEEDIVRLVCMSWAVPWLYKARCQEDLYQLEKNLFFSSPRSQLAAVGVSLTLVRREISVFIYHGLYNIRRGR